MKLQSIIIITVLLTHLTATGQNLFLIGENSYFCTDAITLESNTQYSYDNLDVYVTKNGESGAFAVSRNSDPHELFFGKLIIYLKNGTVITCEEIVTAERVDNLSKALYNLTTDQLNKLKASDIHTVKYTLSRRGYKNAHSASNKDIETHKIISEFFK